MTAETPIDQNKNCQECGLPLGPGREDRKFCNDVCRTAFNNKRRSHPTIKNLSAQLFGKETTDTRKIYERLLKNREILYYHEQILGDEIAYRDLLGRGFNFKFYTSVFEGPGEVDYYFCFDYGYCIRGEKVYILYRPEEVQ